MADPDPTRCPLCGEPNLCAMACGTSAAPAANNAPCWCTKVEIPASLLARVPGPAAGKACVCGPCVARHAAVHERT